jgi:uncharacterized protein (DUF58 family)
MEDSVKTPDPSADWMGPRMPGQRRFRWSRLLWALVYPAPGDRVRPTVAGLVLIGLALGIGSAAYNTANNILFITLSLLLGCLILSGLLSALNSRGACWRLRLSPPLRAGRETGVTLELWNRRRLLPAYGLWFELGARPAPARAPRPESTLTASSAAIQAALARAEPAGARGVVWLRERLDPGRQARLDWSFTPARRGRVFVELRAVGSSFPFGFLRKSHGTELRREAIVWPAPIEYRRLRAAGAARPAEGESIGRPGASTDLLALRRFQPGDSHSLIHWKASARLRQLMTRQYAAERAARLALWIGTAPGRWPRAEQFELLCRFAATLAEDLFAAGHLARAAINEREPIPIRRMRDLESFLDELAVLQPAGDEGPGFRDPPRTEPAPAGAGLPRRHPGGRDGGRLPTITFAPDGVREVAAYLDGEKTATT